VVNIQKKFWEHVELALNNIENIASYYAGGTLSLPLGKDKLGKDRGICLNLSGRGFVLSDIKNSTFYAPDHITKLVRDTYLKYKGETDHYREVVKNG
jgi:hypothetical protein